MSEGKKKNKQP